MANGNSNRERTWGGPRGSGEPATGPPLPRIPGPWGEPPPIEEIQPLTQAGAAMHAGGAALNLAASAYAAAFLVRHRRALAERWPLGVAGVAGGTFAADFVSGLLHWTFDTWFDENAGPLRRMVYLVREHHLRPARIFRYRLRDEAGLLSWFALGLAGPVYARAAASEPSPARYASVAGALTMATEIVLMLEFHKFGHRVRRGRLVRALQRAGLLLSPDQHLKHHAANHDSSYCLITGIADRTLGRLGVFRALEHVVTGLTGARPREDDVQWALRYGRPQ
jgi:hypothetical protein